MTNICIATHSGMGNLLHYVPSLRLIKRFYPDYKIILFHWDRTKEVADWLEYNSLIDEQFLIENKQDILKLKSTAIHYLILSPVGHLANDIVNMASKVIKVKVSIPWGKHESEYIFDTIKKEFASNQHISDFIFPLHPIPKENLRSQLVSKNLVCINPSFIKGDHWYKKHWGDAKYIKIIDYLNSNEYKCILLGDKCDRFRCDNIVRGTKNKELNKNFAGVSASVLDSLDLMTKSKLLVGNDGFLQHAASWLNIPTVTIFTFTSIIKNRPYHSKAQIASINCQNRLYCQHSGNYNSCQCLDVPYNMVENLVAQKLNLERRK